MLARAFGLSLSFETPPPGAWEERPPGEPALRVMDASSAEIDAAWSGRDAPGWEARIDDAPFLVERGLDGDHRFRHGGRSVCLLAAERDSLRCAPDVAAGAAGWRVVLDSVLFSVALLHGYEALHAGAVAAEEGAVAIAAGAGGGKSTLLAELLRRGEPLLSDDVVALEARGEGPPRAHPGPPLMTVPATVEPPPGAEIAAVGDERWVAVPAAVAAIPLAAVVVLDRRPGEASALRPLASPPAALIGSLLRFPRTPERERSRFELAAAIASSVPILRLGADPGVEPATLADLLQAGLGALGA